MAWVGCPFVTMRTTVNTTARPTDAASEGTSAACVSQPEKLVSTL